MEGDPPSWFAWDEGVQGHETLNEKSKKVPGKLGQVGHPPTTEFKNRTGRRADSWHHSLELVANSWAHDLRNLLWASLTLFCPFNYLY